MPIEQKRLEDAKAAIIRALGLAAMNQIDDDLWLVDGELDISALAVAVAAAAFPELASDPPTGWVAPVTASDDIDHAIWVAVDIEGTDPMRAARDAHIKEQGDE